MTDDIWTDAKIEEYKRLYGDYAATVNRALASLNIKGMGSKEFAAAHAESDKLRTQLKELHE